MTNDMEHDYVEAMQILVRREAQSRPGGNLHGLELTPLEPHLQKALEQGKKEIGTDEHEALMQQLRSEYAELVASRSFRRRRTRS